MSAAGFNNGSRLALPGQLQPQPQQVIQQIAAPINDIQMVCLVAAQLPGTPAERVATAQDIVAQAVATSDQLGEKLMALRQRQAEQQEQQ